MKLLYKRWHFVFDCLSLYLMLIVDVCLGLGVVNTVEGLELVSPLKFNLNNLQIPINRGVNTILVYHTWG